MRLIFIVLTFLSCIDCFGQADTSELRRLLYSKEGDSIYSMENTFGKYGTESLDFLVSVLLDTSLVKLANTADMIYPGAPMLYGHGYNLHYDIDWIFIRAGWLIENIAFQDFGFHSLRLTQWNKWEDVSHLSAEEKRVPAQNRQNISNVCTEVYRKVSAWWDSASAGWTRKGALKSALESQQLIRQYLALLYIREKGGWKKLTKEEYLTQYKPLIENIMKSNSELNEIAEWTLRDINYK